MVNRMKKKIDQLIECQGDILSDDAVIMLFIKLEIWTYLI